MEVCNFGKSTFVMFIRSPMGMASSRCCCNLSRMELQVSDGGGGGDGGELTAEEPEAVGGVLAEFFGDAGLATVSGDDGEGG